MLVLALAIVAFAVWLVVRRRGPVHPRLRAAGLAFAVVCAAALALRAGPAIGMIAAAAVALGLWLRWRGGDDRGDDGPGPPGPPDLDPGPGGRADVIDAEAFDRARAGWERELRSRG